MANGNTLYFGDNLDWIGPAISITRHASAQLGVSELGRNTGLAPGYRAARAGLLEEAIRAD
jgi:hypothetical protein